MCILIIFLFLRSFSKGVIKQRFILAEGQHDFLLMKATPTVTLLWTWALGTPPAIEVQQHLPLPVFITLPAGTSNMAKTTVWAEILPSRSPVPRLNSSLKFQSTPERKVWKNITFYLFLSLFPLKKLCCPHALSTGLKVRRKSDLVSGTWFFAALMNLRWLSSLGSPSVPLYQRSQLPKLRGGLGLCGLSYSRVGYCDWTRCEVCSEYLK